MRTMVPIAAICLAAFDGGNPQQFEFPEAAFEDDSVLSQAMPRLASQVMTIYQETDREIYLDNLFRLQMVAGQYNKAAESIAALRQLRATKIPSGGEWVNVQYEIFARAKGKEIDDKVPLEEAYGQAFREQVGRLDDRTSFLVIRSMGAPWIGNALKADRVKLKGKTSLTLDESLKLTRDYQASDSYRQFTLLTKSLIEEDDARRYVTSAAAPVKLPSGATICTLVARPRAGAFPPCLHSQSTPTTRWRILPRWPPPMDTWASSV
jgi:uncharacterized protein